MVPAIHLVADVKALLGEGPTWLAAEQALLWVDIKGRRILRHDAAGVGEWATPMRVGSIVPRAGGGYLAATDEGLFTIALDGARARFTPLFDPEAHLPDNRFNDGKVDRAGRFWAGTMDDSEQAERGALYRLDSLERWQRVDEGYAVTNGPAFSPDGSTMYHTDSTRRTIYRFILADDGAIGPRTIFTHFKAEHGYPDGMTVDAEGCLWVAFWDGWAVRRFAASGKMIASIDMPVQRPTSVAFGGPRLDQLFVTSARVGLDEAALAVQPSAGGLFMLEAGCTGLAERPFAG